MTDPDALASSLPAWVTPPWFASLTRALNDPHLRDERLPLGVLTSEVRQWCARGRMSAWVRRDNATSLAADLRATVKTLGSQLQAAVRPELDALFRAAECLTGNTPPTPVQTSALAGAASALERRLADVDVLDAGWVDVWKAAKQENLSSLQWRTLCLRDLLAATGRDPRTALTWATLLTGDDKQVPHTDAALSALRDALTATPATGRCVVWLSYDHASLMSTIINAGPVTLYDARWAIPNAAKDNGQPFVHRDELRTLVGGVGLNTWSDETEADERRVIVRVDFGERGPRGAIDDAERVVQTMTQIAAYQWGGSSWRRSGLGTLFIDGRPRQSVNRWPEPFEYTVGQLRARTAEGLAEHAGHLAVALTAGTLRADLIDAVWLLQKAAELDRGARGLDDGEPASGRIDVILEDAAVEHLAAFGGMTADELDGYLLEGWAHAVWTHEMERAIDLCLYPDPPPYPSPKVEFPGNELLNRRRGTTESLALAAKHREAILAAATDRTVRKYGERWLRTLTDVDAYQRMHRDLTAAGAILTKRASRVRNSLVHGNPADERVIATVREISRYRAYKALDVALQAVADGAAMLDELNRRRMLVVTRNASLSQGVSLADQWATT